VTDPVAGYGAAQHPGDVVLDEEVGEALRAVAAGEGDHTVTDEDPKRKVPQAPRSDTGHRLALLPARS
jgi:hypothetical protein